MIPNNKTSIDDKNFENFKMPQLCEFLKLCVQTVVGCNWGRVRDVANCAQQSLAAQYLRPNLIWCQELVENALTSICFPKQQMLVFTSDQVRKLGLQPLTKKPLKRVSYFAVRYGVRQRKTSF